MAGVREYACAEWTYRVREAELAARAMTRRVCEQVGTRGMTQENAYIRVDRLSRRCLTA